MGFEVSEEAEAWDGEDSGEVWEMPSGATDPSAKSRVSAMLEADTVWRV